MIQSNLIFEGIDRIGKSSIIEELNKRYEMNYLKVYGGTDRPKTIWNQSVYWNSLSRLYGNPYLIDRGHISELVYGRLLRNDQYKNGSLEKWLWMKDSQIQNLWELGEINYQPIIIYIEPLDKSKELWDDKNQKQREIETELYKECLSKTKIEIIQLETMDSENNFYSLDSIIDNLLEKLK